MPGPPRPAWNAQPPPICLSRCPGTPRSPGPAEAPRRPLGLRRLTQSPPSAAYGPPAGLPRTPVGSSEPLKTPVGPCPPTVHPLPLNAARDSCSPPYQGSRPAKSPSSALWALQANPEPTLALACPSGQPGAPRGPQPPSPPEDHRRPARLPPTGPPESPHKSARRPKSAVTTAPDPGPQARRSPPRCSARRARPAGREAAPRPPRAPRGRGSHRLRLRLRLWPAAQRRRAGEAMQPRPVTGPRPEREGGAGSERRRGGRRRARPRAAPRQSGSH